MALAVTPPDFRPREAYLSRLAIRLIQAQRARTKGKIERRFEFIHRDVVREPLQERSLTRLNAAGQPWRGWANPAVHSRAVGGHTASHHDRPSAPRRRKAELPGRLSGEGQAAAKHVMLLHVDLQRYAATEKIKDFAYQNGVQISDILFAYGIEVRDRYLREHRELVPA